MNLETFLPIRLPTPHPSRMSESASPSRSGSGEKRRPGRPPTYIFSKPDSELSENERRLKGSVIKRRLRQNRSYHKKKRLKELAEQAARERQQSISYAQHQNTNTNITTSSQFTGHDFGLALGQPVLPNIAQPPTHSTPPPPPPPPPYPVPRSSAALHRSHSGVKLPSVPSNPSHTTGQDQAVPISAPSSVYPTQTPSFTHCTNPDALSFFAANASRQTDVQSQTVQTRKVPVSGGYRDVLSVGGNPALQPMLPPTDDRFLGNMLRSQGPRFESSMMDMPSSNAQVHGHSSVGTPYLSVSSPMRSPTEAKKAAAIAAGTSNDDKDEAQLLADILDPSDQRRRRAVTEGQTATSDKVVRPLINRNVGAKSFSLPKDALQDGLKHLVLFPRSFTSDSALFVMGLNTSMQGESEASNMALQPLVDMQLLRKLDSARYVVSDLTKGLIAGQPYDEEGNRGARQRYVSYYMEKLRRLDNRLPGASGKERLDAMKVYDVERENVQEGLEICREMGGKCMMIEFLSVAATLMRYSTTAKERVDVFGEVVASLDRSGSPERASMNAEARVRLALGEAYFDLLEFDSAEEHLGRAIASMAGGEGRSLPVSTSVLALMLLAELKIRGGEHEEARKLLIQALKSLKEGSLAKSAFAVCCLLNLASTYALSNQLDEAGRSVNAGLEVLTERGFTHMPIYADALGTIGSVHAQRGRWEEAQQLFLSGLNEVQAWMAAKGWERAPIQHCAHLHILLVESIAQTYRAQERHEDAARLAARAREQRKQRGLRERAEGRRGVEWSLGRHLY